MTLLINKQKRHTILWNQEQESMSKRMGFCHVQEIYLTNVRKNYWILYKKIELNALKTASQKLVHETPEATGEFIGNKIVDKVVKTK